MKTPAAEVEITEVLVRHLLETQFPQLAHLPLQYLNEGWDNVIFQLGSAYLIRLPRRSIAVPFIEKEQTWLSKLNSLLSIPIPAPVHQGKPLDEYPWPWSITPWFTGRMAAEETLKNTEAGRLARFLATLHGHELTEIPPHNPSRATPLATKAEGTEQRLKAFIEQGKAVPRLQVLWESAVQLDCPPEERSLIHGDLHPKNMITDQGRIAAIIDWGDLTLGDPATDLAAFWLLFAEERVREQALAEYSVSPKMRIRAIGWAIFFSTILLDIGLNSNDPLFIQVGQDGLDHLAETTVPT